MPLVIGIGDGEGMGHVPPPLKKSGKIFFGQSCKICATVKNIVKVHCNTATY